MFNHGDGAESASSRSDSPIKSEADAFKSLAMASAASSDISSLDLIPVESTDPKIILEMAYHSEIPSEERVLLQRLDQEWSETQPFLNKKILINAHMTLITLTFIKLFISAGAEVHTTATPELVTHDNALFAIEKAGLPFYKDGIIPEDLHNHFFDIVYDCGAGMLQKIRPKLGMVELTHTDSHLYDAITFPVITVDTSKTKQLETRFGTGDSLTRVLVREGEIALMTTLLAYVSSRTEVLFDSPAMRQAFIAILMLRSKWQSDRYILFGYGKVGRGIAYALIHAGVSKSNIHVAEISTEMLLQIKQDDLNSYCLNTSADRSAILSLLKAQNEEADVHVITATGVEGTISRYFELDDFANVTYLINMGTPDEFGEKFPPERVLNKKKPANFMLQYPTKVKYLDPIFYIWAKGGEELTTGLYPSGRLSNIDKKIDDQTLSAWTDAHEQKIFQHPTMDLINDINALKRAICKTTNNTTEDRAHFVGLLNRFGAIREAETKKKVTVHSCFSPLPSQG